MEAPLASAVIGGLLTSTLLTLIVVPTVYTLFDDLGRWLRKEKRDLTAPTLVRRNERGVGREPERRNEESTDEEP